MKAETVEQAFKKIIKEYWKENRIGKEITSYKDQKYNKTYFKGMEEEFLASKDVSKIEKLKEKKGKKDVY